jgi:uncharacterized Zn-binding protein involved in type VI secretion
MGKPAARVGDFHVCPKSSGARDHQGGPVLDGCNTVLIGARPAALVGARCACNAATDTIVRGSATVLMGGRPAVRIGDATAHGGVVSHGEVSVLIGG